ncbi:MAG: glycogen synthase GlgA [Nevskia sp.]|nr:glycogen synthase GlgA [Nevskia sp.]
MTRALFAVAELLPIAKIGGLADVAAALPSALAGLGVDIRIVVPAYRGAREKLVDARWIGGFEVQGLPFAIWQGRLPGVGATVWLAECAPLYARAGGDPYRDEHGAPWPDNALRFGAFCEAVARLARDGVEGWRPEVVHCNDWHTGLIPVWLSLAPQPPRTIFTIHNLAYQGLYDRAVFDRLGLPASLWTPEGLEFYGRFSFMKAGLAYADALTTVSPTYAREIQAPEHGWGLDGVLRHRAGALRGILNGIDDAVWNPATDPLLARRYTSATVGHGKRANKLALQSELGLAADARIPLLAFIGRLVWQKGGDLILAVATELLAHDCQLAVLGTGDRDQEAGFAALAARHRERVSVHLAYDERLAHRIEAGADVLLMPSRYEPCGLNQMYSQRYGTVPVARRVGGLADTVNDATPEALAAGTATGVLFDRGDPADLANAARRALALYRNPALWRALRRAGMRRDFSWRRAAAEYLALYRAR